MSGRGIMTVVAVVISLAVAWVGALPAQGAGTPVPTDPWPRPLQLSDATGLVYQPQVNSWQGNHLDFRAAVAITPTGSKQETFGMVTGTAWTVVDKVTRKVTLEWVTLRKVVFPTLPNDGAAYTQALQAQLRTVMQTLALDRLETSLAASGTVKPDGIPVNNTPPEILVSYSPAVLIPIDGTPVLQPVPNAQYERVINTQALILREQGGTTYYLHVYNGWLYAGNLQGPWWQTFFLPAGIDQVAQDLAKAGLVDLIDGGKTQPKPSLANGVPTIYVREVPAELIVFKGEPAFESIAGTSLTRASNTANDVILDTTNKNYYVLLSGRWYAGPAVTGPWSFVASPNLPTDFRKIPPASPAGIVLASVAGTPQAEEAVIANSIPQTATIPRVNGPAFKPVFDGAPQFRPITGTLLDYVANSPTPIIQVDATLYYALQGGVWFSAISLNGPWYVAPSVPAAIYTIPPTSPLHYVTYVQVYGSTAQVVYVGYTPGYLGTVVASDGVVVYGTGYTYPTWVGTAWYPPPATYGVMAQPVYNPAVGMTFGFAMGLTTAAVAYGWGATPYYHPAYYGYPCCGSASANVYGQWGSTAYSGNRTWYNNPGGSYGTSTSGSYTNYHTGTTGSYSGGRSYNPYTGQAQASYTRSFNTPEGVSGSVSRGAQYNAESGTFTRSGSATATGPGGRTESVTGSASSNVYGQGSGQVSRTTSNANTGLAKTTTTTAGTGQAPSRQTTVYNSKTGQYKTFSSGEEAYADKNGNVYRNSDGGWKQHTGSGWQGASGDTSWADKEQQARTQGEDSFSSFKQSGGGSGSGWGSRDGGGGGWGHFDGGGGWGDRFGGGGGSWASRFGGGGGGWGHFGGGRFGGFRR